MTEEEEKLLCCNRRMWLLDLLKQHLGAAHMLLQEALILSMYCGTPEC